MQFRGWRKKKNNSAAPELHQLSADHRRPAEHGWRDTVVDMPNTWRGFRQLYL